MPRSLYDELQVPSHATAGRIRHAYEQRVRDLTSSNSAFAQRELREVERAYATLSDPDKRERYNSLMGLPGPEAVLATTGRAASGGLPGWLWPVCAAGGVLVALVGYQMSRPKLPPLPASAPPAVANEGGASAEADPPRSKWAEEHERQQKAYDEKVRREFEVAQRRQDYQRQTNDRSVEAAQRNEEYRKAAEDRKRASDAQRAEYELRAQQRKEEAERRQLEARQREELAKVQRQIKAVQEGR
jgi:curved DNA-binding protein CbpA